MTSTPTQIVTVMTTVFTPPASCTASWTYESPFYNSVREGLLMQNCLPAPNDANCFPPRFTGNGRVPLTIQIYSPGVCPVGYATPGLFSASGTTTAICCPTNFVYFTTYSRIFPTDTYLWAFLGCISTFTSSTTVSARTNNYDLVSGQILTGPLTMWAQPITVAFQQKDLSLFNISSNAISTLSSSSSSTSRPTLSVPSSTSSSATSSSSSPTPTLSTPQDPSGLSGGAKIGMGVGFGLAVILIIGLAMYLIRRRRRNKNQRTAGGPGFNQHPEGYKHAQELSVPQQQRQEMQGHTPPARNYAVYTPEGYYDSNSSSGGGTKSTATAITQRGGEIDSTEVHPNNGLNVQRYPASLNELDGRNVPRR